MTRKKSPLTPPRTGLLLTSVKLVVHLGYKASTLWMCTGYSMIKQCALRFNSNDEYTRMGLVGRVTLTRGEGTKKHTMGLFDLGLYGVPCALSASASNHARTNTRVRTLELRLN